MQKTVFDYRTNEFKHVDGEKKNNNKNSSQENSRLPFVAPGKFYLPIWR